MAQARGEIIERIKTGMEHGHSDGAAFGSFAKGDDHRSRAEIV